MKPVLRAEGVSYAVGSKLLVRDVSLDIVPGRLVVGIGPNGAGKSTLMRLLSGELPPSQGRVLCGDTAVRAVPPVGLACIRAVLPQSSRLAFPFTVAEVVRIGLDGIGRGLDRVRREEILADALRRADVAGLAGRTFQTLSGGEGQRAQFARVLAQLAAGRTVADRQALLLDEPIASLDLKHQLALLETAADLAHRDGVAVFAILHDLNLAAAFADEIAVLHGGRLVAQGPPEAVLHDRMVREVFEVELTVGAVPSGGRPFLLPARAVASGKREIPTTPG